jgi:hypothetical protein
MEIFSMHVRKTLLKEWALFALSVGIGGHVVLALMLHTPNIWPWDKAGIYGLLIGISVYVALQLVRSLWWMFTEGRRNGTGITSHR